MLTLIKLVKHSNTDKQEMLYNTLLITTVSTVVHTCNMYLSSLSLSRLLRVVFIKPKKRKHHNHKLTAQLTAQVTVN